MPLCAQADVVLDESLPLLAAQKTRTPLEYARAVAQPRVRKEARY